MNGSKRVQVVLYLIALIVGAAIGGALGLLISAWLGWG